MFGEALPGGSANLSTLLGAGQAVVLPGGAFKGIGDFNGDDIDDLAAAVLTKSTRLDEQTTLEHQVVQVYLGKDGLAALGVPKLVLEPGQASFVEPGSTLPQPIYFGALEYTDKVTLAVAGPIDDALRFYPGADLRISDRDTVAAPPATVTPELFRFDLATPKRPASMHSPFRASISPPRKRRY